MTVPSNNEANFNLPDHCLSGYLAPEYAMRGQLTEKADVFAFGVVALEAVSGRPNTNNSLEESKIYLLEWVIISYSTVFSSSSSRIHRQSILVQELLLTEACCASVHL
jgi:hypothetical protein